MSINKAILFVLLCGTYAFAATVNVSPDKLDFGDQVLTTRSFQLVTLSNPTKKVLNIFFLGLVIAIGSCNKQLIQTPPSNVSTSSFYTNTNDFLQAVNGVYNRLRAYPDQALWMGEMRSDNVAATSDGNRDWQGINDFSPNLTNTAFIVGAWDNDFNGIYNANTVLNALATQGTNVPDTALRNRFVAECRFLRAFYYFDLLRFYGQLPIVDKVMSPGEVATVKRSPVGDVYNFIISDLQFAISNLPQTYTGTDIGRPTTYSAKGILGLVYMTKSGPTYNVNGPGLNSNEYDKALQQFNDTIASGIFPEHR